MSENSAESAKPPTLPVTSAGYVPPTPASKKSSPGWRIATGLLALTTIGAVAWGITQTNSLQGEVAALQTTVEQQDAAVEVASKNAQAMVDELDAQVAELAADLDGLEQDAGDALDGVTSEHAKLKKQLAKTERAAADLKREQERAPADATAIASAYEETLSRLFATQDAMAELLMALVTEGEDATSS